MALVLFRRLNMMIVIPMQIAMPTCTFSRVLLTCCSVLPPVPRMSTVNDVVNAVNAEPPAAYEQEIRPVTKRMPTTAGRSPLVATAGKSWSPVASANAGAFSAPGTVPAIAAEENMYRSTPSTRNRKMTTVWSIVLVTMFF